MKFSIATNACLAEGAMIRHTVPHWLRVFGERLQEIVLVVDYVPAQGRIAELHQGCEDVRELESALAFIASIDDRIKVVSLQELPPRMIQRRWFGRARPVRCQAGTPLLAFVSAIEQTSSDLVLRCDSDMLFREGGWLEHGSEDLIRGSCHVYEPPRLHLELPLIVSSRAFMIYKPNFNRCLPLRNLTLDPLRRVHRALQGRPPWLPLEQMLQQAGVQGKLKHAVGAPGVNGFSLHALRRAYASLPEFPQIVASVERGAVPSRQKIFWDLDPELWRDALAKQWTSEFSN